MPSWRRVDYSEGWLINTAASDADPLTAEQLTAQYFFLRSYHASSLHSPLSTISHQSRNPPKETDLESLFLRKVKERLFDVFVLVGIIFLREVSSESINDQASTDHHETNDVSDTEPLVLRDERKSKGDITERDHEGHRLGTDSSDSEEGRRRRRKRCTIQRILAEPYLRMRRMRRL
jgi:hypothetical protein